MGARGGRESGKLSASMRSCAVEKGNTKNPFALYAHRMYVGPGLVSETKPTLFVFIVTHHSAELCDKAVFNHARGSYSNTVLLLRGRDEVGIRRP